MSEVDCCRLCSSQKNLISMFNGKSRTIRDFLRKMIEETVYVKIEQHDSVPLICFNCAIDVSNFYFFKLHCQQNERRLQDTQICVSKAKKCKLQSLDLKDIKCPDIESTEKVLNWLNAKRISLIGKSTKSTNKSTQTFQINWDVATQWDIVETHSKECQTANPKLTDSEVQCEKSYPELLPKISIKLQSSQSTSSECTNCMKNNGLKSLKKNTKNCHSQTTATSYYKKSTQTETSDVMFSRTGPKELTPKLFQSSIVTEVYTQDGCVQTEVFELVNKYSQCDILKLNCYNNLCQTKAETLVDSKECKNNCKIVDLHMFNDALLNGLDNIFVSKMTQTDLTVGQFDQLNISNSYFENKDIYLLSPSTKELDARLSINALFPVKIKEEIISPTQSFSIPIKHSPDKNIMLCPQSVDLPQVDTTKSDSVKICKICDKTLCSKREVMTHNKMHMQCKICKKKFRSLKAAQIHSDDCKVKQAENLPFVDLIRIDQTSEIKGKYSQAFKL